MIKIENTSVYGWEAAVRGMRNPLNSWEKIDSGWYLSEMKYRIGENDLALMKKLYKAGSDHRKYLRYITVTADITAPLYWWKEYDTYKVGTVANSCSTMHKIHAKEFMLDDFSHERLTKRSLFHLKNTIDILNYYRDLYLSGGCDCFSDNFRKEYAPKDKECWEQLIQLLPSSYNQKRTVLLNYEVLINQYFARKEHKLDEWHDYCHWIETLPYWKEICLNE